jgi:hypothetical protein
MMKVLIEVTLENAIDVLDAMLPGKGFEDLQDAAMCVDAGGDDDEWIDSVWPEFWLSNAEFILGVVDE